MRKFTAMLKDPKRLFVVLLATVLLASVFANLMNTSFYTVSVKRISFDTPSGTLSGLLYLPKDASKDDPRPTIITTHGYLNSAEMQDAPAIEMSRRGYVVLALDMYDHGHSITKVEFEAAGAFFTFWTTAMYDATKYMYDQDYVLKDRNGNGIIAVSGHSMGGFASSMAVVADEMQFATSGFRRIHADLTVGSDFSLSGYAGVTAEVALAMAGPRISGKIAAHFDEFFFDMAASAAGKTVIYKDYIKQDEGKAFLGNPANPEPGVFYKVGNARRVIYTPYEIHPWNHFSIGTTANIIDFYAEAFDGYKSLNISTLGSSSQIWWLKEMFEFIALLGFFAMLMPLASILLATPVFASLSQPSEKRVPGPKSATSKAIFWVVLLISAAFPAYFFPDMMDKLAPGLLLIQRFAEVMLGVGAIMLVLTLVQDKAKNISRIVAAVLTILTAFVMRYFTTKAATLFVLGNFFNQPTTNQIVYWALMSGFFGLIVMSVFHFFDRSRNPEFKLSDYGLSASPKNILLAFVLAVVLVLVGYAVLFLVDALLVTDFRLWSWAVKTFDLTHLRTLFNYVPFFFVFYLINSVAINLNSNNTYMHGWKGYLVGILMTVGGLIVYLAYHYGSVFATGTAGYPAQALNSILLFALIPTLIVAVIFAKRLYKKTGNVYTAAVLNAVLMTMITVANTIMYFNVK